MLRRDCVHPRRRGAARSHRRGGHRRRRGRIQARDARGPEPQRAAPPHARAGAQCSRAPRPCQLTACPMSLSKKKVAILESRLGRQLVELVEGRGGIALHAPALAELPDLDPDAIAALVRSLESEPAKLAIFQTGVGTRALFPATDSLKLTEKLLGFLKGMIVAVRGPKPTAALRARGVRIDRSATDPFTTKEVLASFEDLSLQGERVIVQRHGSANVELDR